MIESEDYRLAVVKILFANKFFLCVFNKYTYKYEIKCNRTEIIADRIKIRDINIFFFIRNYTSSAEIYIKLASQLNSRANNEMQYF